MDSPTATSASALAAAEPKEGGSHGRVEFAFGMLADIQYADIDDKMNASRNQLRRYRGALDVARRACRFFSQMHGASTADAAGLSFVVHCGDIIDHNAAFNFPEDDFHSPEHTERTLSNVMSILSECDVKDWVFTLGNHEMYNFSRQQLAGGVDVPGSSLTFKCTNDAGDFYYSFSPHPSWRVLVVVRAVQRTVVGCPDPYDVSIYSKGRGQGLEEEALRLLCRHNHNARAWVEEHPDVSAPPSTRPCQECPGTDSVYTAHWLPRDLAGGRNRAHVGRLSLLCGP
eukprot:scaffold567_cov384-Prasinococcus_capsulatus_cf.AAC.1